MKNLSKTKLLCYRQCPKRLWLEVHRPELRQDSADTKSSFATGHEVGEIARSLYDPKGKGILIDPFRDGFDHALEQSRQLVATSSHPLFEAGFAANGALAFADIMIPRRRGGRRVWQMVEVKSSTEVKDYHRDDAAVQAYVARAAGVPLQSIALAHVDKSWVYPGGGDYSGLLREQDLTEEVFGRDGEVASWIAGARAVVKQKKAPVARTGEQCQKPYACGFVAHCHGEEGTAEFPAAWLPGAPSAALKAMIAKQPAIDMREVPDAYLNNKQLRVKQHTVAGRVFFDAAGALEDLRPYRLPAYFMDFESIQFAVPRWKGTTPYAQIPFQFSIHRLSRTGKLEAAGFLDLSGKDPSRQFAQALVEACGERGPIYVYNDAFEKGRVSELAARFPRLARPLEAIKERIVDLLPIARNRYYHPAQQGKWSIKSILPTIAPELRYDSLDGVQNGGSAMAAYLEAISSNTPLSRKLEIRRQLSDYCSLDTLAMVRLWQYFGSTNFLVCHNLF